MYVDIHHHLVHGVDDGPRTIDEVRRMLLAARRDGISQIIATPHALPGREPFPLETFHSNLSMARDWCAAKGIPIQIRAGCEVLYTESAGRLLSEGQIPSLAGGRFVLLEFLPGESYERLRHAVRDIGNAGFIPVLAHIERYSCLDRPDQLLRLREQYMIRVQVNARSVLPQRTALKKVLDYPRERHIRRLLEAGLVDYIATDAHDARVRRCCMQAACDALTERYDAGFARALCGGNQREILQGAG